MANTSIFAAFEEMWQHVIFALNGKSDVSHKHDDTYETKTDASNKLGEAKEYTDTHNVATDAHNDIRLLISELVTKLTNFLDVDDTTTDQLSEVITLINNNKGTLESLTTSKVNVADIINNLTTNVSNKPLSAAQGVVINGLINSLQTELNEKANTSDLTSHTENGDVHITADERTAWNAKATVDYVDESIAAITTSDVSGQINEHNTATDSHSDIRESVDDIKINAAYIDKEDNEDVTEIGGGTGNLVEIYQADYDLLSEEEKNADNVAYFIPDGNVDGVDSVDMGNTDISGIGDGTVTGAISALASNVEILWTNPNSTSVFTGQFVNTPKLSNYKLIVVSYMAATGWQYANSMFVPCVENLNCSIITGTGAKESRTFTVGNNGVTFSDAIVSGSGVDNSLVIPYMIYGIK